MIEIRVGDLADVLRSERPPGAPRAIRAVLRPVSADGEAVTNATRRLELASGTALGERFRALGELPVGSAVVTPGDPLGVDLVVHVVVRSREEQVSEGVVRRGLLNGLRRLREFGVDEVILPPLGTGAGNLDAERSAEIVMPLLRDAVGEAHPRRVVVVVENEYERDAFLRELKNTSR